MYIYKSQVGGWSSYRGQRKLFHEAANVTNVSVADVSLKYSFTAAKSSAYMIYDLPPLCFRPSGSCSSLAPGT